MAGVTLSLGHSLDAIPVTGNQEITHIGISRQILSGKSLTLAVVAMALTIPAFAANSGPSPAQAFVNNRFNHDSYPVITCPTSCVAPTCAKLNGVCYDVSDDDSYWDAVRIVLTSSGTVELKECLPYVTVWTFRTWNGDQTGTTGEVNQKREGVTAEAWLDGVPVEVLESPSDFYEWGITGPAMVKTATGWQVDNKEARSILTTCDLAMKTDCPNEVQRDPGEKCWGKTFGVDLSGLSAGKHELKMVTRVGKGFPNAGQCTTTEPNCYCGGTGQRACTSPHPTTFDDWKPCADRWFTLALDVTAPGGCDN